MISKEILELHGPELALHLRLMPHEYLPRDFTHGSTILFLPGPVAGLLEAPIGVGMATSHKILADVHSIDKELSDPVSLLSAFYSHRGHSKI